MRKTMAGWLDGERSSVEGSLGNNRKSEVHFGVESDNNCDRKIKPSFDKFLAAFLKEFSSISCARPLPPVIGEGVEVDLYKLHLVVRNRGGYSAVSEKGLWTYVARDCGFDFRIGAALKLVYVKYLDTFDRWLSRFCGDKLIREANISFPGLLMELESDLKVFLSVFPEKVKKEEEFVDFGETAFGNGGNGNAGFVGLNADVKSVVGVVYGKNSVDNGVMDDDFVSRKRKRECSMNMLEWIRMVAKDPCNPAIGVLPESHRWKCYGSELVWREILLVRDMMLSKKNADVSFCQSRVWQKQKMHPSMFEDDQFSSERQRCSKRLIFAKDTSVKARDQLGESSSSGDENPPRNLFNSTVDSAGFWFSNHRKKRVPISPHHQAQIPDFCGAHYEPDSKWLGTQIWPLNKHEMMKTTLIERDPIGKGRQESCGCQFPGSLKCVQFHTREKRKKVKLELGSAFSLWRFHVMGDEVALLWRKDDEDKFQEIVETNRLSSEKYFWDELFKYFPKKGRESLVSYYFNVFLLRRRADQNRSNPSNIDSDDEEAEFGPIGNRFGQMAAAESPGSIFCSPRKSHLNGR